MLVKPTTKLYACIRKDGTVISDTVLGEVEFSCPLFRHAAEGIALSVGGCSRVLWADVTDVEALWLDDDQQFVPTPKGIGYLQSASIA
jgi:hypothetical protein